MLEQKRASEVPKPPTPETGAGATPEPAAEVPGEHEDAATFPIEDVAPERAEMRRTERGETAHKARRSSSRVPTTPRSSGLLPFALGAAVFAVMFLAGAMRAMRETPGAATSNATRPSSPVDNAPARGPSPSVASSRVAAPVAVAADEPPTGGVPAPAVSVAEPIASAAPIRDDETVRVMVRSAVSGAKFYRYGKQVGVNSIIVELNPGETRAFEVDLPGHVSRKVVVDGSRSEVVVILPRVSDTAVRAQAGPTSSPTGEATPAPPALSSTP